jgi:hypothetical protein
MAILLIFELPGVGPDKYDQIMKALGFDQKPNWPKGFISHAAGAGPNGWTVVDLWESEADFGAFQQSQLGPAFLQVGGLPEPKITVIPVHFSHAETGAKATAKPAAKRKPAGKKKKKK